MKKPPLTQKELVKITKCPPYLVRYYCECGYLPVERESAGPGHPVVYAPGAIDIIRKRMERSQRQSAIGGADAD